MDIVVFIPKAENCWFWYQRVWRLLGLKQFFTDVEFGLYQTSEIILYGF